MEMMIWSGPFATSWDLAFGSIFWGVRWDELCGWIYLLGARWRWDLAFGRDSCFVCARWRFWLSGSELPVMSGGLNGA